MNMDKLTFDKDS